MTYGLNQLTVCQRLRTHATIHQARFIGLALGLAASCITLSVRADEGRIPIFQPTTIMQSGSYVLTRDLIGATCCQPILVIQAKDVTIDLNGYRIIDSGEAIGIRIDSPTSHLRVRNGTIESNAVPILSSVNMELDLDGVSLSSAYDAVSSGPAITLRMQRSSVFGHNTALRLGSGSTADVSDSYFSGDFVLSCIGTCNTVRFVNNLFSTVFYFGQVSSAGLLLEHNTFKSSSSINVLTATANHRITSNSFYGTVNIVGDGNLIDGNQFLGPDARLIVTSNQNRIIGNQISGATSHGIDINGSTNLIEGNSVTGGNAFGLFFAGGTGNAYKNNFLMNNSSGAVGGSLAGQTDGGGNIP
jgi:hypothetical protein